MKKNPVMLTGLFADAHLVSHRWNDVSRRQRLQSQIIIAAIVQAISLHSWEKKTPQTDIRLNGFHYKTETQTLEEISDLSENQRQTGHLYFWCARRPAVCVWPALLKLYCILHVSGSQWMQSSWLVRSHDSSFPFPPGQREKISLRLRFFLTLGKKIYER